MQARLLPMDDKNIPFLPLYPPMTAIAFKPLASLSYLEALGVWWAICIASYIFGCWILATHLESQHLKTIVLAMAGFFPFFVSLRAGQLVPVLLLVVALGLHFRNGLVLSLLALKPQFAVGMLLYWSFRREWRLCIGMLIGIAIQASVIAAWFGPGIFESYLKVLPLYVKHSTMFVFPDGWVHSMSGLLGREIHWPLIVLVATVCALGSKKEWRIEAAHGVLFMLFFTPHLLLYDLLFLLIPIVFLVSNEKVSLALVVASSAVAFPLWAFWNMSLIPVLLMGIILGYEWNEPATRWIQNGFFRWRFSTNESLRRS